MHRKAIWPRQTKVENDNSDRNDIEQIITTIFGNATGRCATVDLRSFLAVKAVSNDEMYQYYYRTLNDPY